MKTNFFTIPNILTLLRLPLAGLIILFADSFWKFIFLLFSLSFDILDGYLAKKLNQSTQLGAILDSSIDKIFCLIVFVFFFIKLNLPIYFIFLFFILSIIIVLFFIISFFLIKGFRKKYKEIDLRARFFGKKVTGMQFITLLIMMLGNIYWVKISIYIVFVMSLIALIDYSIQVKKTLKKFKV